MGPGRRGPAGGVGRGWEAPQGTLSNFSPSLHPRATPLPETRRAKGHTETRVSGDQLYRARGRGSPHPVLALARARACPLGGAGSGEHLAGGTGRRLPALLTPEAGRWQSPGCDPEARRASGWLRGPGGRSAAALHFPLPPWATGTHAFRCFSQCLTWHSLQAGGPVRRRSGGCGEGVGAHVLGCPHLQQYHSFWQREQRLEASALQ